MSVRGAPTARSICSPALLRASGQLHIRLPYLPTSELGSGFGYAVCHSFLVRKPELQLPLCDCSECKCGENVREHRLAPRRRDERPFLYMTETPLCLSDRGAMNSTLSLQNRAPDLVLAGEREDQPLHHENLSDAMHSNIQPVEQHAPHSRPPEGSPPQASESSSNEESSAQSGWSLCLPP